jgi:hypothetical protein
VRRPSGHESAAAETRTTRHPPRSGANTGRRTMPSGYGVTRLTRSKLLRVVDITEELCDLTRRSVAGDLKTQVRV